jgi:hypothetical protein
VASVQVSGFSMGMFHFFLKPELRNLKPRYPMNHTGYLQPNMFASWVEVANKD